MSGATSTRGGDGSISFKVNFPGFKASDINRLLSLASDANEAALKQAGFDLRKAARKSLVTRKKASKPGQPPSVHTKHKLANLRNITFSIEARQTLTVGPRLFKQPKNQDRLAANIQEFGGSATLRKKVIIPTLRKRAYKAATPAQKANYIRKIKNGTLEKKLVFTYVQIQAYYAKRPFMAPAFEKEKPKFPSIWKSSISQ